MGIIGCRQENCANVSNVENQKPDNPVDRPDFQRIAKDAKNNVRDALMTLEVAIMGA